MQLKAGLVVSGVCKITFLSNHLNLLENNNEVRQLATDSYPR
jgi:hypothetical protein